MENGITESKGAAISQAGAFNAGLMDDFVSFLDRGEATTKTYITNLRQFRAWMLYAGVTQPERADILQYREWLTTEHEAIQLDGAGGWTYRTDGAGNRCRIRCKSNTVALYLRSVGQFFRWTAANGLYKNVAENIHAPKVNNRQHKKGALTAAEMLDVEKGITAAAAAKAEAARNAAKDTAGRIQRSDEQGKRLYAMFLLATNAGLRTVEISRANVCDIQTRGGQSWLYIWGKGHSEADQRRPIAAEVAEAVRDYLKARKDSPTRQSPLFVATGNRSGGKRLDATTVSKMLKKAMVQAGYDSEYLTPHSLRHGVGTTVKKITGDLYAAQKYMRHESPATTEIYIHDDEEEQAKDARTAQRLYDYIHGGAQAADINQLTPAQLAQLIALVKAQAATATA